MEITQWFPIQPYWYHYVRNITGLLWVEHTWNIKFYVSLIYKLDWIWLMTWVMLTLSNANTYIHIHNWPLQPFSQDYSLASHTMHVVCVYFIREWRDQQFNVDFALQIFEKLFHGGFIYFQSFCQKSAERKSPKKFFLFIFHFLWLTWDTNPGFTSNKPTHYLLDYGDFLRL